MSSTQASLLAELEADLRDNTTTVTRLLQKCLLLGQCSGSERLRQWAKQELNGYTSENDVLPDFRHVGGIFSVDIVTRGGEATGQPFPLSRLPQALRDSGVNSVVPMNVGVAELEDMVRRHTDTLKLSHFKSAELLGVMNATSSRPGMRFTDAYWQVSVSALHNVVEHIRTTLMEMVGELRMELPSGETVPSKELVDRVFGDVVVNGPAHFTVVQPAQNSGPSIIASGAAGTAIGAQTANGPSSSVVGNQLVNGDGNAVTGRDTSTMAAKGEAQQVRWWTRLRKRILFGGMLAIVGGTAVFGWIGWKPWE